MNGFYCKFINYNNNIYSDPIVVAAAAVDTRTKTIIED